MEQAPQSRGRQGGRVVFIFVSAAGRRKRRPAAIYSDRSKVIGTRSLGILASSLCVFAQLPFIGCSNPKQEPSDINFRYESQPIPPHVGSNIFVVKLNDKKGRSFERRADRARRRHVASRNESRIRRDEARERRNVSGRIKPGNARRLDSGISHRAFGWPQDRTRSRIKECQGVAWRAPAPTRLPRCAVRMKLMCCDGQSPAHF